MIPAYPLTWPAAFPKTGNRITSKFSVTIAGALKNVTNSLILFGKDSGMPTTEIVISSNCTLGVNNPKDGGVAVWFKWEDKQLCIAVDRYLRVEENLQAIYHIIESRRTELRHGGLQLIRQAFAGFKALPEPQGAKSWWDVLECLPTASEEVIKAQYKRLAKDCHPDTNNGSIDKFIVLQTAYNQALNN